MDKEMIMVFVGYAIMALIGYATIFVLVKGII